MPEQTIERRPKSEKFKPKPETLALLRASGNPINGLGETEQRRPSPFFWHPPELHPFKDLQVAARASMSECPGFNESFGQRVLIRRLFRYPIHAERAQRKSFRLP